MTNLFSQVVESKWELGRYYIFGNIYWYQTFYFLAIWWVCSWYFNLNFPTISDLTGHSIFFSLMCLLNSSLLFNWMGCFVFFLLVCKDLSTVWILILCQYMYRKYLFPVYIAYLLNKRCLLWFTFAVLRNSSLCRD